MAAWNVFLGDLNEPNDAEQQNQDGQAVFWAVETKRDPSGENLTLGTQRRTAASGRFP
jgi:hypothetical protein